MPPLRAVQSLWMASLPLQHVDGTSQFGAEGKLAEGVLSPTVLSPTKMLNVLCATLKPSYRISDHSFSLLREWYFINLGSLLIGNGIF